MTSLSRTKASLATLCRKWPDAKRGKRDDETFGWTICIKSWERWLADNADNGKG